VGRMYRYICISIIYKYYNIICIASYIILMRVEMRREREVDNKLLLGNWELEPKTEVGVEVIFELRTSRVEVCRSNGVSGEWSGYLSTCSSFYVSLSLSLCSAYVCIYLPYVVVQ
jgi:hypothetical protein